jgi:glucose-1-phosphate adenylyltransferase
MEHTLALILAGGRGKRMDILCSHRPKPALPFAGNFRVIDFSLSNCVHSRIADIGVLVDYQRKAMAGYLGEWHALNGEATRLHVLPPSLGSYLGTADAVYQNLKYLEGEKAATGESSVFTT